jgi:hypothetical protein
MIKKSKKIYQNLYDLLQKRPFCKCAINDEDIYDAYCLRIIETLEMMEE